MGDREISISNTSKFVLCPKCQGTGVQQERTGLYESRTIECQYCKGHRVVREVTKITHVPVEEVIEKEEVII